VQAYLERPPALRGADERVRARRAPSPNRYVLSSEQAAEISRRGWQNMDPIARRARTLRMRIAGGQRAQQELDELLHVSAGRDTTPPVAES
jgi:hypothetical protein